MTENICVYKLYQISKSRLEDFLNGKNVAYKITENDGDIKLELSQSLINDDSFIKEFLLNFKEYVYANKDVSLIERLIEILKLRNLKISVAESFTGGNISSKFTSISGVSSTFIEGIIAYSNESKIKRLNVLEKTLNKFNPVSKEVCYEMCKGLLENSNADLVISTTGIAGPNSDNSNYPVGLCYLGVGSVKKIAVNKFNFKGTREKITRLGVDTAIFLAVMALIDGSFDV